MKIAICGGTGLIGKALTQKLLTLNHEVILFSRGKKTPKEFINSTNVKLVTTSVPKTNELKGLDVLINLAGESVVGSRWSEEVKNKLRTSRVDYTNELLKNLSQCKNKPELYLQASAIGYYGFEPDGSKQFTEDSPNGSDFLAKLCYDWEKEAEFANTIVSRLAIIRIGVVISSEGGAIEKMLPPFKAFVGGPIGSGEQFMSWIHIDDLTNAIVTIINNKDWNGVFNLTSPNPLSNSEFSKVLAKVLNRPSFVRTPEFAIELLFGEGAQVITKGQNVFPKRLKENTFSFQFETLEIALNDILN
ncbi:MAG: TIGR01777 family oxidoreductase [Leptospiraceae bacterium]|nr:TIGR01777 family oxidoreductase [Leptospiraceae bacterium]